MFMVIILTSLITLLVFVITSVTYLVSLLSEESDDINSSEALTTGFEPTPIISPIDSSPANGLQLDLDYNHSHDHLSRYNFDQKDDSYAVPNADSSSSEQVVAPDDSTGLESSNVPDSYEESSDQPARKDSTASKADSNVQRKSPNQWLSSAAAQKNLITTYLGGQVSKQLFNDFDLKEMQLGGTGLHWCRSRQSLDKLVKLGVPINFKNNRQETPLHVAVRKRKLQVLIGLLCYGADVDQRNSTGETPLMLACKINDIFACMLLLVFDADYNLCDNLGLTARHYTATTCEKNKAQIQTPNSAHLILAMMDEIGARRCIEASSAPEPGASDSTKQKLSCTEGCAHNGTYNGNSYNRWPNYEKESFYKKHMFYDIVEQYKTRRPDTNSVRRSRLLCIDGGGMRGVIVCQILMELQKYLKNPIISYFDWVGGTSVGAFLACAICNGTSLLELRRISFDVKDEVFSGNKPYNAKFIERVLKRTYGPTTRLSAIKNKKLAVTTVIADRDPCQLRFFRNYKSPTQLLEHYGFAADIYNNISCHSNVTRRPPPPTTTSHKSPPKVAYKMGSLSSERQSSSTRSNDSTTSKSASVSKANREPTTTSESLTKEVGPSSKPAAKTVNVETKDDPLEEENYSKTSNNKAEDCVIDEHDQDPLMWQAVRASAAAPFFFKPYGPYLDGGIISNNPTLDMMTEFHNHESVKRFIRKRVGKNFDQQLDDPPSQLDVVISLGTGRGRVVGRQALLDLGSVAKGFATVFSPVELLKSIRAARDLFKKLMQQSCQTEDHVLDRAQSWCSSLGIPYFRINPALATIFSIDDKRDEQLINALWQAKLFMRAMRPQLEEVRKILDD